MYKRLILSFALLMILLAKSVFSQDITFTFANGQITGTAPQFYEFDVMVEASVAGTRIGDALVYINYSGTAFGLSIVANGKITVTKGSLISGALYNIVSTVDNTTTKVAITTEYINPSVPGSAELLPVTPTQFIHLKIEIATPVTADLGFDEALMEGQQFQSDNATIYVDVIAIDEDNTAVPVELASFTASVTDREVVLHWTTASETNNFGFDIERSEKANEFQKIGLVEGNGTTTIAQKYSFVDENLVPGTYSYRLKQIDFNGVFEYSGMLEVVINVPNEFALDQNYPNPFNPETTIRYDLPESSHVVLKIFNILGEEVKTLVDAEQTAGIKTIIWNGKDKLGKDVSSGAYIYQMQAGGFTKVKKLTLLR